MRQIGKKQKIGLIAAAVAVVVVLAVAACLLLRQPSPERTFDTFCDSLIDLKLEQALERIPAQVLNHKLDEADMDMDTYLDTLKVWITYQERHASRFSYEFEHEFRTETAVRESTRNRLTQQYLQEYGLEVTDVVQVEGTVFTHYTYTNPNLKPVTNDSPIQFVMVKISEKWYVDLESLNGQELVGFCTAALTGVPEELPPELGGPIPSSLTNP